MKIENSNYRRNTNKRNVHKMAFERNLDLENQLGKCPTTRKGPEESIENARL